MTDQLLESAQLAALCLATLVIYGLNICFNFFLGVGVQLVKLIQFTFKSQTCEDGFQKVCDTCF